PDRLLLIAFSDSFGRKLREGGDVAARSAIIPTRSAQAREDDFPILLKIDAGGFNLRSRGRRIGECFDVGTAQFTSKCQAFRVGSEFDLLIVRHVERRARSLRRTNGAARSDQRDVKIIDLVAQIALEA